MNENLIGKRVKVVDNGVVRYGTIVDFLTKQECKKCMMYGQLIFTKMDDTGKEEELLYDYEILS